MKDSSPQPLRVLHLAAPAEAGGLESVVRSLAVGHHGAGLSVKVVALVEPRDKEHPLVTSLREAGVDVLQLELSGRAYLEERRVVRRLATAWEPDVIHTHGERSDVLHIGAARRMGVPAVTTVHGSSRLGGKARLHVPIQLLNLRRFDAVVAVSRPLHRSLSGLWVSENHLHLVPNAWDGARPAKDREGARRALRLDPDSYVLGWVGRMIPVKGGDIFLRAAAQLDDAAATSCMIGDGLERARLEALASSLRLNGRVSFAGAVDRAAELMPAFDIFVLSSRSEGTPVVLFEAMAAGVPIVATEVGGVPDVLSGAHAVLVPPGDPAALARGIRAVMAAPAQAAERARAAERKLQEEFASEVWLQRYEAVYRQAICSRGGPNASLSRSEQAANR